MHPYDNDCVPSGGDCAIVKYLAIVVGAVMLIAGLLLLLKKEKDGLVNAGYAVIPLCFCFVFVGVYSGQKKKEKGW